jgi:uncharacterized membrane protein YphA (DoxX/SURF4 family)
MFDRKLEISRQALRVAYGVVPIVAGLDKFTNLLTDWTRYLHPLVEKILPISGSTFMHVVGVIEIAAGILVLSKLTRFGAYVVSGWLAAVALSLVAGGHYFDVAVRDLMMALGAFVLAKLTEARAQPSAVLQPGSAPAMVTPRAAA